MNPSQEIFNKIRDIPYSIRGTRGKDIDPVSALEQLTKDGTGSCTMKNIALAEELKHQGWSITYMVCGLKWTDCGWILSELNPPEELINQHVYIRAQRGQSEPINVDATWDSALKKYGCPVNEWDGETSTPLGVKQLGEAKEFATVREMQKYRKRESESLGAAVIEKHKQFAERFNLWLEGVRKK